MPLPSRPCNVGRQVLPDAAIHNRDLRVEPPLLWLPQATGFAHQTGRRDLGKGRAAIDEAGEPGRSKAQEAQVRVVSWRDQSGAGKLIKRDFQAAVPDEKWLTDITEFQIPAGKVYFSPIIDCFDGMVVRWTIGTSPDAELVNTMLNAAIETVADTACRPVVHSDRGGNYRCPSALSALSNTG